MSGSAWPMCWLNGCYWPIAAAHERRLSAKSGRSGLDRMPFCKLTPRGFYVYILKIDYRWITRDTTAT